MAEKTKEQLKLAVEKEAQALQSVTENLEAAQKELAEKPEDGKLKKRVEGLEVAVKNAKQKLDTAETALKNAEATDSSVNGSARGAKKVRLRIRNKTGRPTYYRAGLCFGPVDAEYEVTEEVANVLAEDPWLDGKTIA